MFYKFFNNLWISDDKIAAWIEKAFDYLLADDYSNVFLYLCDTFSDEELTDLNKIEPGSASHSTIGITYFPENHFDIVFALQPIRALFADFSPFEIKDVIQGFALHEAFHVLQFSYLFKCGGLNAIKSLNSALKNSDYTDNVLELGAFEFQLFGTFQDFSVAFQPYLQKVA